MRPGCSRCTSFLFLLDTSATNLLILTSHVFKLYYASKCIIDAFYSETFAKDMILQVLAYNDDVAGTRNLIIDRVIEQLRRFDGTVENHCQPLSTDLSSFAERVSTPCRLSNLSTTSCSHERRARRNADDINRVAS